MRLRPRFPWPCFFARCAMGPRRRGRELAFQILYQMDLGRDSIEYVLRHFEDLKRAKDEARSFAQELSRGAAENLPDTDALITACAKNWDFKRLSSVDRALLRLGAYELLHRPDIPAEVTLNECIEMAKSYGTDDSPGFVNGILDQIRREKAPPEASKSQSGPKKRQPRPVKP